jgi:hypothetical protein
MRLYDSVETVGGRKGTRDMEEVAWAVLKEGGLTRNLEGKDTFSDKPEDRTVGTIPRSRLGIYLNKIDIGYGYLVTKEKSTNNQIQRDYI